MAKDKFKQSLNIHFKRHQTMFPIPLAQAESQQPELARKPDRVAAIETSDAALQWIFATFSKKI